MGNFFEHFQIWKLHTPSDYLEVFVSLGLLFLAGGIMLYYAKKRRTQEAANIRVRKALRRLCKKTGVVIPPLLGQDTLCTLMILGGAVYAVQVFPWGTNILGQAEGKEWKLIHGTEVRLIPNPLTAIAPQLQMIKQKLSNTPAQDIPVHPLIVFADNFSHPVLGLDEKAGPYAVAYHQLKHWMKANQEGTLSTSVIQQALSG